MTRHITIYLGLITIYIPLSHNNISSINNYMSRLMTIYISSTNNYLYTPYLSHINISSNNNYMSHHINIYLVLITISTPYLSRNNISSINNYYISSYNQCTSTCVQILHNTLKIRSTDLK